MWSAKPRSKARAKTVRRRRAPARELPRRAARQRAPRRSSPTPASRRCRLPSRCRRPMLMLTCGSWLMLVLHRGAACQRRDRPRVHARRTRPRRRRRRCRLRHFRNPYHRQPPHPHRQDPGSAGHAAGPVHLRRRSAAARRPPVALDWIAAADVRRRYPDAIFVTVVEKRALRPVAGRRNGGRLSWWSATAA